MLLLTSLTLNINTQAQIPTAAVSITCDGKMEIDVQTEILFQTTFLAKSKIRQRISRKLRLP